MKLTERDHAIMEYSDAFKEWAGIRPKANLDGIPTEELRKMANDCIMWASEEFEDRMERERQAARMEAEARKRCRKENQPPNLAFSRLADLLAK